MLNNGWTSRNAQGRSNQRLRDAIDSSVERNNEYINCIATVTSVLLRWVLRLFRTSKTPIIEMNKAKKPSKV